MNSYKNISVKIFTNSLYILLIDQLTKFWVFKAIGYNNPKDLIPILLRINLVKNKGAAFSLFSNSTAVLTIISILASIILIFIILNAPPRSYWNQIGLAFLLGGTLGNGIDRLFKGYVLDFIDLALINFPIFNVADISINFALICIVIDIIRVKNSK